MGDDPKRLILARRARFVAAALAGINTAMCGGKADTDPKPCLSVIGPNEDAGPRVCLSPPGNPPEERDAAADADAGDAADADPDAGDADPDAGDAA